MHVKNLFERSNLAKFSRATRNMPIHKMSEDSYGCYGPEAAGKQTIRLSTTGRPVVFVPQLIDRR